MKKQIWMCFPEGKLKALTLSYDDGVLTDQRLISIMNAHGLRGTFNINSNTFAEEGTTDPDPTRRMTRSEVKATYLGQPHEIAIHGLNHGHMEEMSRGGASYETAEDRRRLEEMFGGIVRGMAYPYGSYDDELIEVLRANDIVYSRTTRSHYTFELPTEFLTWHPTCHHNAPNLSELADEFLQFSRPNPALFYLWGHSYEFERNNNWEIIEQFAEQVGDREDIWYATNMELYQTITAYRSLITSADRTRMYNPTAHTVWLMASDHWNGADPETYCIRPGEILDFSD